jgi:hypothetical protein
VIGNITDYNRPGSDDDMGTNGTRGDNRRSDPNKGSAPHSHTTGQVDARSNVGECFDLALMIHGRGSIYDGVVGHNSLRVDHRACGDNDSLPHSHRPRNSRVWMHSGAPEVPCRLAQPQYDLLADQIRPNAEDQAIGRKIGEGVDGTEDGQVEASGAPERWIVVKEAQYRHSLA